MDKAGNHTHTYLDQQTVFFTTTYAATPSPYVSPTAPQQTAEPPQSTILPPQDLVYRTDFIAVLAVAIILAAAVVALFTSKNTM